MLSFFANVPKYNPATDYAAYQALRALGVIATAARGVAAQQMAGPDFDDLSARAKAAV